MTRYVEHADSHEFIKTFEPESIDLLLFDPPYYGIVKESWDNQWKSARVYVDWFYELLYLAKPKMKPHGSVVFFGALGSHGSHPMFEIMRRIESQPWPGLYYFRNMITWKKRRAYGKSHDYLFIREEICWYSMSEERTNVRFNIPLTDEKRGYAGWSEKYPAKSEFKRVGNVFHDLPELMRPERNTQKPLQLMRRLVDTHSNAGDLVVDPFCGWGTTGIAAVQAGRAFRGCEAIEADADAADERVQAAVQLAVVDR